MNRSATYALLHVIAALSCIGGCILIFQAQPGEQTFDLIRRGLTPQWNFVLVQLGITAIVSGVLIWAFGTVVGLLADIRQAAAVQGELAAALLRERAEKKTFGPIAPAARRPPTLTGGYEASSVSTPWGLVCVGDKVWDAVMTTPAEVVSFLSATTLVVRQGDGDPFALEAKYIVKVERPT